MTRTDYFYDPHAPKANHIIPAASAIITNPEGNILLQRRRDNAFWALPGGTMEIGESISATVIREVKEETGLDVQPLYIVGIYSDPHHVIAYTDGEVRQQFSICFYCIILGGAIQMSEESTDIAFFSLQEIEQLPLHPSTRLRIQHYSEHRNQPVFQ